MPRLCMALEKLHSISFSPRAPKRDEKLLVAAVQHVFYKLGGTSRSVLPVSIDIDTANDRRTDTLDYL